MAPSQIPTTPAAGAALRLVAMILGALLVGGAIWLTMTRAPALMLDLSWLPFCG